MAGFGTLKILDGTGHTPVTWPLAGVGIRGHDPAPSDDNGTGAVREGVGNDSVGGRVHTGNLGETVEGDGPSELPLDAEAAQAAVVEAERIFLSAIKGPPERMAFKVDPATGSGSRITEFDAEAEEIIVIAPMQGGMDVEDRRAWAFQMAYQMLRDAAREEAEVVKSAQVLALAEKVDRFLRGPGVAGTAGQVELQVEVEAS